MRSFPYKLLSLQWTCKSLTEGYSRLYIAINDTTGRRGREERGREREGDGGGRGEEEGEGGRREGRGRGRGRGRGSGRERREGREREKYYIHVTNSSELTCSD